MGNGLLICFTGIDGSGKTTHAKSLLKYLKGKGYPCIYVWGAFRPILSYTLFVFTRLFGYWNEIRPNAYTDPLEYAPRRVAKNFGMLLSFMFFVDFYIKTLVKIRLPLLLGKNIICDRYFYDLLMELERTKVLSEKICLIFIRTLPQPIITFLLDASYNVIKNRRNFSQKELNIKRRIFLRYRKLFNFVLIDSSKDFLSNKRLIQDLTLKCLNSGKLGEKISEHNYRV